jgi:hypothetical protein
MRTLIKVILTTVLPLRTTSKVDVSPEEDAKVVAALDTKYQAAVKANECSDHGPDFADDLVMVAGRGKFLAKPI